MLSNDLLDLAKVLVSAATPTQATLRRAVSTAYYATFHLLAEQIAAKLVQPMAGQWFGRCLEHRRVLSVAKWVKDQMGKPMIAGDYLSMFDATKPLSPELARIGVNLAKLQGARHRADYDPYMPLQPAEAQGLVDDANDVFADWGKIHGTIEASAFLAALLLGAPRKDQL